MGHGGGICSHGDAREVGRGEAMKREESGCWGTGNWVWGSCG